MKHKNVGLPDDLFDALKEERRVSGIPANAIIILAVTEYLKKKERERRK